MEIQQLLINRVRAVNLGHIRSVELIYLEPHQDGRYAAALRTEGHGSRGHVQQISISKPMVKSLQNNARNRNLDNLLRI